MKIADLTLALLLEKLTMAATELLQDRLMGGNEYVTAKDDDIMVMLRRLMGRRSNFGLMDQIKEIKVRKLLDSRCTFEHTYVSDGEEINMIESTMELAILINPTCSGVIDDLLVDQDMVAERMNALGYKCQSAAKRSSNRPNKTKKHLFKPRRHMCQRTKNRIRKNQLWVPDTLRIEQVGPINVPAVIIS